MVGCNGTAATSTWTAATIVVMRRYGLSKSKKRTAVYSLMRADGTVEEIEYDPDSIAAVTSLMEMQREAKAEAAASVTRELQACGANGEPAEENPCND